MGRKRDKDYYCTVKEVREAFWHKQGHSNCSFKYWHLILSLHNDYSSSTEVLQSLTHLQKYLKDIPHYDNYLEEAAALESITSKKGADLPLIINSKLKRAENGWEVDLWCLRELTQWDYINKIRA